jgi:hypothetical protein
VPPTPFDYHPAPNRDRHVTGLDERPPCHTHQQAPPARQTPRTRRRLDPKTTRRRGERVGEVMWTTTTNRPRRTQVRPPSPLQPSSNADPPPLQSSARERHVKRPDHGLTKTAADKPQPRVNNDSGSFDSDNGRSNNNNNGGSFDNNSSGLTTNAAVNGGRGGSTTNAPGQQRQQRVVAAG